MSTQAAESIAPTGQAPEAGAPAGAPSPAASGAGAAETPKTPEEKPIEAKGPKGSVLGGKKTEEKKVEAKPADGEKPKEEAATDLEIKLPEGVKIDPKEIEPFKATAKGLKLNSEQASALVAWDIKRQADAKADQEAALDAQHEAWGKEIETDKDFGGEKYAATEINARKALLRYGGPDAAKHVEALGVGNNPFLVKMLARVGAAMAEDKSDTKDTVGPGNEIKNRAQVEKDFYSQNTRAS